MTEQEAKVIISSYGAPANIAQHIEAINTAIRVLGRQDPARQETKGTE